MEERVSTRQWTRNFYFRQGNEQLNMQPNIEKKRGIKYFNMCAVLGRCSLDVTLCHPKVIFAWFFKSPIAAAFFLFFGAKVVKYSLIFISFPSHLFVLPEQLYPRSTWSPLKKFSLPFLPPRNSFSPHEAAAAALFLLPSGFFVPSLATARPH